MQGDGLLAASSAGTRWLAEVDGRLRRPGNEHILEMLVRQRVISTDDLFQEMPELLLRPETPVIVAMLAELPSCDTCRQRRGGPGNARYDARIVASPHSLWGYMCPECFAEQGPEWLGMGLGQYLMTPDEVSSEVWDAFERAEAIWMERLAAYSRRSSE
jgi:hypothetical protein